MFCTICQSIILPDKSGAKCTNGHKQTIPKTQITEKNTLPPLPIQVSDGKNILAVHDHVCTKCHFNKAELVEIGCFYSDEDVVAQYKCGKCAHVDLAEGKLR